MNLIYTQSSGFVYSRYTEFTVPLMKRYAEKIGVEFIHDHSERKPKYPLFEKFKVGKLLDDYDRVLFLDCDILIKPDAPDIFDLVPLDHFAALNEGSLCTQEDFFSRWPLIEKAGKAIDLNVSNFDMRKEYFNGGVFLVDKSHKSIFDPVEFGPFMSEVTAEQNVMNIRLHHGNHKTFDLPIEFNYMPWRWKYSHLQEGHFIHYAGLPTNERYECIKNDYLYLTNP